MKVFILTTNYKCDCEQSIGRNKISLNVKIPRTKLLDQLNKLMKKEVENILRQGVW